MERYAGRDGPIRIHLPGGRLGPVLLGGATFRFCLPLALLLPIIAAAAIVITTTTFGVGVIFTTLLLLPQRHLNFFEGHVGGHLLPVLGGPTVIIGRFCPGWQPGLLQSLGIGLPEESSVRQLGHGYDGGEVSMRQGGGPARNYRLEDFTCDAILGPVGHGLGPLIAADGHVLCLALLDESTEVDVSRPPAVLVPSTEEDVAGAEVGRSSDQH